MKIPWKEYAVTVGLCLFTIIIIYPIIRPFVVPLIQKIPFIGKYAV